MFGIILKAVRDIGVRGILVLIVALLVIAPISEANSSVTASDTNQTKVLEPVQPNAVSESFYRSIQTKIQITNTSSEASKNVKIQVPLISVDPNYQETLGETYSIKPIEVINENLNTRKGTFLIDSIAPGTTETLVINYNLIVNPVNTLLAQNVLSAETGDDTITNEDIMGNLKEYLKPSQKIESNSPEIKLKAAQITQGLNNDLDKARKIFTFVKEHMKYNLQSPHRNKGAVSALNTGEGVCEDYAALFAALSRAAGIPARQVNGYADPKVLGEIWNINSGQAVSLQNYRHSWVEFYIHGMGWIPADPTFSPINDSFKYFGYLPFTSHIAQNYQDQSLKVSYQGQSNGLKVQWEEVLVNLNDKQN